MTGQGSEGPAVGTSPFSGCPRSLPAAPRDPRPNLTAQLMALPRPAKVAIGGAIGVAGILAIGVPLSALAPVLAVGGCLAMHVVMDHGAGHGGHAGPDDGAHREGGGATTKEPADQGSTAQVLGAARPSARPGGDLS
jgi:hypothetical protein